MCGIRVFPHGPGRFKVFGLSSLEERTDRADIEVFRMYSISDGQRQVLTACLSRILVLQLEVIL